jgi:glycosyltransferase involved in cell wall biosynthesis
MLSLCMIVKDEVVTLPACLASVRGVVDEIVILDTGSSDDTIAVAQDAGAQVHRFEWTNDFAAARNASLTHARGDWILVLDADERLLPVAIPAIRQLVAGQELAGVAAADVLLVNLVRHEAGAKQSPYTLVSRLFRRHPDLQFQRPYHETVDESVDRVRQREPHWQVVTLADVAIDHGGYRPDAVVARAKVERARSILESMVAAHPADPYGCNKLGALYLQNGLQEKALPLLRQGLATGIADPVTCYELHYHLGLAYRQQNQLHQAIEHYQQALEQPVLPVLKVGTMLNLGSLL